MKFQPLQPGRRPEPCSHQDWLFEIKYDGFRTLAHIEHGRSKLVSRNGSEFKSFRTLSDFLATELKRSVILDPRSCLSTVMGSPCSSISLFMMKGQPRFVAFDLLHCDGQDLTYK